MSNDNKIYTHLLARPENAAHIERAFQEGTLAARARRAIIDDDMDVLERIAIEFFGTSR